MGAGTVRRAGMPRRQGCGLSRRRHAAREGRENVLSTNGSVGGNEKERVADLV